MAEIRVQNLHKAFADFTAVKDSSFTVNDKEFFCLLGPSGCGKTTTLRMIAGLELPTSGQIFLGQEDVTFKRASARDIAFVFQMFALYPHMTVRQNIAFPLASQGMSKAERSAKATEAIELVNLVGHEEKYPKQLSGGMKMRCSLARALVMNPSVFLFDEPFGALDEITRERLNDELLSLFQRQRFASLFITHSIAEAVFLSTRVLVMSGRPGEIVGDFDVPFSYPRSPELRFDPAFAELCGQVSHALRGAHV